MPLPEQAALVAVAVAVAVGSDQRRAEPTPSAVGRVQFMYFSSVNGTFGQENDPDHMPWMGYITCHRGKAEPEFKLPPGTPGGGAAP